MCEDINSFIILIATVSVPLSVPFIADRIKKFKCKYRIDIQVKCLKNNMVLFSASIENMGDKNIIVNAANIYIDEGKGMPKGNKITLKSESIEGAIFYDFPFLLQHIFEKHNQKKSKCILCKKCRNGELIYPIGNVEERFQNGDFYYTNIALKHLTKESITYISSKEKHSEDVILQFKKNGVYRVTFVIVSGNTGCQCATKQFYIPKDSK